MKHFEVKIDVVQVFVVHVEAKDEDHAAAQALKHREDWVWDEEGLPEVVSVEAE